MTRELKGWSRSRPMRVAFLIEEGEHCQLALDGIFADCYSRWGGRFSLIVPCESQCISAAYWPWLEVYDPDIVYSYVSLSRASILELHERVAPAQYIFHEMGKKPRLDAQGFRPNYSFKPLASLSVIYTLARGRTRAPGASHLKVVDCWFTEQPTRLLTDNLGTYHRSYGSSFYPPDAEPAATLLTIVSPEKRADRQYGIPKNLDTLDSELDAFKAFVSPNVTSLSLVSAMLTGRLEIGRTEWSATFNLVIGDSFQDRILFWNARLHIPGWLDSDLSSLRLSFERLHEPTFLAALVDLLNRRNHVNAGSGGTPSICICSVSLTAQQLEEAKKLITSTKLWSITNTKHVDCLEELVPPVSNLENAWETRRFGIGAFNSREWTQYAWTPPTARHSPAAPEHLGDAPLRQAFCLGYWYADCAFEYPLRGPRYSGENRWALPKRWRVDGAFGIQRASGPQNELLPLARRSRGGNLAVPMCAEHPVEAITIPTALHAIQHALVVVGGFSKSDAEHDEVEPPQRAAWIEPSNEARHLIGVLGMTGSLQEASHYLLHPFLEQTFAKLGGATRLSAAGATSTMNRLGKLVGKRAAFDLNREDDRAALAVMILKAARGIEGAPQYVRYDELKKSWEKYRKLFWEKQPPRSHKDDTVDWDSHEAASLDNCLIALRRKRMLYQGHAWTCKRCLHKNWVDIGALKLLLACEVCNQQTHAPVDIPWLFRPNEFLIESLRNHSVLSLVWTLAALCQRAHSSLLYVEPTCFGFSRETKEPGAEADLMVLLDGKAVLCEVKSSWHSLRVSDVNALVDLAKRLRPDIALLAVMEESGNQRQEAIETAKAELLLIGISLEVLTLSDFRFSEDPYLHFWDDED